MTLAWQTMISNSCSGSGLNGNSVSSSLSLYCSDELLVFADVDVATAVSGSSSNLSAGAGGSARKKYFLKACSIRGWCSSVFSMADALALPPGM